MLKNLVNGEDAERLLRLGRTGLNRALVLARTDRATRVSDKWDSSHVQGDKWHNLPMVRRRWATMISGDPEVGFPEHAVRTHLSGRSSLRALALGTGGGMRVFRWARSGAFARIDGFDIAGDQVARARRAAVERGLDGIVHFDTADVLDLDLEDGSYDVVIGEQSIHHLSPMDEALRLVRRVLTDDGWFFVDEYVGPPHLQWTDRQLEAASGLVAALPATMRMRLDGRRKDRADRPSRLFVRLKDPSEATESDRIRPLLHELFDVVEEHDYGGAILHLALNGIAHHFGTDDPERCRLLEAWFLTEDLLMAAGEVGSDFMVAACRRPRAR